MAGTLVQALSYAMLAVVAALAGGLVAICRPPGKQMESNVQHFATGVVFAAGSASYWSAPLRALGRRWLPAGLLRGRTLGVPEPYATSWTR